MDTTTNDGTIDDRSDQLLTITVAGKTDVGKTAIIRTFTYDRDFGKSKPGPDVTRKVECKPIQDDDHETILEVCDSSGLHHITEVTTDPTCKLNPHFGDEELKTTYVKLRDDLEEQIPSKNPGKRRNQLNEKLEEYKQDLSVINHITNESDLVLFVVNVSQEPTKDDWELALGLSRLATPVIPVMNFDKVPQNYKNDWEILFGKYFQLFATFDAFNLRKRQIKMLRNQITAILKTRDPKKAGVFADWAEAHDAKFGMQMEDTIYLITNLILDSANCVYKKNIRQKEQQDNKRDLKDKLLKELISLESVCHEKIIKKLGFEAIELRNLGRNWEGFTDFEGDTITNTIRWYLAGLPSLWMLGEDETGDLIALAPGSVLEDLLGRALEVAVLFLQRGHAKSKQKGEQELLKKKPYELDKKLKENVMGNSLFSKVRKTSEGGKNTLKITSESPESRWRDRDKDAFDKLRNLIRDELSEREESH